MPGILSNPNGKALTVVLAAFFVLAQVAGAKAEICKWVDEQGGVHFAESCPEDVQGTEIEIQPPPSQSQIEAASGSYAGVQPQPGGQEEDVTENDEQLAVDTGQSRGLCMQAKLSLDALSQKQPVYYDQTGVLRTELHESVRMEFDRSGMYLNPRRRAQQVSYWKQVERDHCTPEVLGSGIRSEMRRMRKEHQRKECSWWGSELEYMERNKGFHEERLDLKTIFNANCK